MKPRLGKKGRKALAAKKAAPKKKAAKVRTTFKAPQDIPPGTYTTKVEDVKVYGDKVTATLADPVPAVEESGVGDGCAVGGSESEAGPEFNPA